MFRAYEVLSVFWSRMQEAVPMLNGGIDQLEISDMCLELPLVDV